MLADIVAQFDYFLDPSLSFIQLLQAASFYLHVLSVILCRTLLFIVVLCRGARARYVNYGSKLPTGSGALCSLGCSAAAAMLNVAAARAAELS